jgi:hypothetical protein
MCAAAKRRTTAPKIRIDSGSAGAHASGRALELLLRAFKDAAAAARPARDFAVELSDWRAAGASFSDLRWLVSQGYTEHRQEWTLGVYSRRK